jgi:hypothetical protein
VSTRNAPRLREAIKAYRTEQNGKLVKWALELLDRLANSSEAAQAFEELKLRDGCERNFLMLCILARELALAFPERVSTEQRMPATLRRLDDAISKLRLFVTDQMTRLSDCLVPQTNLLPSWGLRRTIDLPDGFGAVTRMMHGLDLIAEVIEKRRRLGVHIMAAWRATRKKQHKNAATIAAIRLLADGTRRITGKPHIKQLRTLAPVILDEVNLSDESVSYALRARKKARSRG